MLWPRNYFITVIISLYLLVKKCHTEWCATITIAKNDRKRSQPVSSMYIVLLTTKTRFENQVCVAQMWTYVLGSFVLDSQTAWFRDVAHRVYLRVDIINMFCVLNRSENVAFRHVSIQIPKFSCMFVWIFVFSVFLFLFGWNCVGCLWKPKNAKR